MRRLLKLCSLLVVALATGLVLPARAQAGERILSYDVDLRVEPAGTLRVTERIDYDFGADDRHGIFRDVPVRFDYDDRHERVYRIDAVAVQGSPGTPDKFELSDEGSNLRIKIGDPDRTISGRHGYTITYRVAGALNGFADHDELYWNAVGTQWSVPVEKESVRLAAPAPIDRVACYAGPEGATTPCGSSSSDGSRALFGGGALDPFEGLTVVASFPAGAVPTPRPILDERWTLARAFAATPATLGMAGAVTVALAGLLLLLMAAWYPRRRRAGGDGAAAPPLGPSGVEPAPPDGIHPAELGLVAERTVAPVAVSATIVDLAVRGYLRIEEVDGAGKDGDAPDWRLVELKEADEHLAGFERDLLAGLFGRAKEPSGEGKDRDEPVSVKLSNLNRRFHEHFAELERSLYGDAVKRGWFAARPDRIRRAWRWTGVTMLVVGAALTVVAGALTHAGLVPLPVFVVGLALVVAARWMPSRTPIGRVLARRVKAFRAYLTMPGLAGASDAEAANLFAPYLPYAIVLGLTERWAMAFADRATPQALGWYRGSMPFSPYWGSRMDHFSRSSASTLTSAPPSSSGGSSGSGFSGGFSGGGGGGGGGGSW